MDDHEQSSRCAAFLALHERRPFVMANAWDAGSARLCEALGFPAVATTSSGSALRLGKLDYQLDLAASLDIAGELAAAVDLPVSVDFEDGFATAPGDVAANVTALAATGVAGVSVEDYTRDPADPIYPVDDAVERVRAAVEAAHAGPARLVLSARTEILTNRGPGFDKDTALAAVVDRLQRFQDAGADVLFAPGLRAADDISAVLRSIDRPLSLMAMPGVPSVRELGDLGVARVSLASWFAYAALEGVRSAASEVLDHGTFGFMDDLGPLRQIVAERFGA